MIAESSPAVLARVSAMSNPVQTAQLGTAIGLAALLSIFRQSSVSLRMRENPRSFLPQSCPVVIVCLVIF